MSLINNILDILKDKHQKQSELCTYLGINTSTMTNWKNRDTDPPAKYIIPICEFLNISPYYLLTGKEKSPSLPDDEQELLSYYNNLPEWEQQRLIGRAAALAEIYKEQVKEPDPIQLIPTYYISNCVSAGFGEYLEDYEQGKTVYVPDSPESRRADFVLTVSGDSMEPKFHDGDNILVRSQPTVEIGQIGIFDVDGEGYIKKLGDGQLISLNKRYPNISLKDRYAKCFGLVLGTTEIVK